MELTSQERGMKALQKFTLKNVEKKMELTKTKFLEEAHRCTNTELQTFHATYPKVLVCKVMWHGHPSLLMPFLDPSNIRVALGKKVMDTLRKLKDGGGHHLKYNDDDVRWQHIDLCRKSGQVQLFDFNEMEVIPSKDRIEDEVERQWKILAGRVRQGTDTAL